MSEFVMDGCRVRWNPKPDAAATQYNEDGSMTLGGVLTIHAGKVRDCTFERDESLARGEIVVMP